MTKILIIGKKSFIGSHLTKYLSRHFVVNCYSFEEIIKKNKLFLQNYTHVINTSIHKNYINYKYKKKFDLDIKFVNKFKNCNFKYLFLNTRKIYFQKENISEKSKISPIDRYGYNKYVTETLLKKKLAQNLISLRISNIIGKKICKNSRNNHKLFFDNFLEYRKKNKKIIINDNFKDFITIDQFSSIIKKIINSKIYGTFNISLSKKVYISEIISWIDKKFLKNIKFYKADNNSFTLSNKKIKKRIKINLSKRQLMLFCKRLIKK
jgi:nucleoside-diphosphate-sugar epimerase